MISVIYRKPRNKIYPTHGHLPPLAWQAVPSGVGMPTILLPHTRLILFPQKGSGRASWQRRPLDQGHTNGELTGAATKKHGILPEVFPIRALAPHHHSQTSRCNENVYYLSPSHSIIVASLVTEGNDQNIYITPVCLF